MKKILKNLKNFIFIIIIIFISPHYLYKILKLKQRNKNNLINFLKCIKPILNLKSIDPSIIYKICSLYVKIFTSGNECLLINSLGFTILKKFFYPDIIFVAGTKKGGKEFLAHCWILYNGNPLMQNQTKINDYIILFKI